MHPPRSASPAEDRPASSARRRGSAGVAVGASGRVGRPATRPRKLAGGRCPGRSSLAPCPGRWPGRRRSGCKPRARPGPKSCFLVIWRPAGTRCRRAVFSLPSWTNVDSCGPPTSSAGVGPNRGVSFQGSRQHTIGGEDRRASPGQPDALSNPTSAGALEACRPARRHQPWPTQWTPPMWSPPIWIALGGALGLGRSPCRPRPARWAAGSRPRPMLLSPDPGRRWWRRAFAASGGSLRR